MEWWAWLLIVVVIAAVVMIAWGASSLRRDRLRRTFGPEYDRTVDKAKSRRGAEGDLRGRLKKHRSLELRPLAPDVAAAFAAKWTAIQVKFVDVPETACDEGEQLLDQVLRERGYPVDEDFDTQADLVSVDHPHLVGDYRLAHETLHPNGEGANGEGSARSLEDLRGAFVIYRNLFSDVLDEQGTTTEPPRPPEADADEPAEIDDESGRDQRVQRGEPTRTSAS